MSDSILFIASDSNNFLVQTMMASLGKARYQVDFCGPYASMVSELHSNTNYEFPDIIIVFLEDMESNYKGLFPYVESLLVENDKRRKLYLIGQPSEIIRAKEFLANANSVTAEIERPVTVEKVLNIIQTDDLNYVISTGNKRYDIDPSKKTLLIVDDDVVYLTALKSWFNKTYNVIAEKLGTDAIGVTTHYHIDLMLLDYEMPLISGLEVFRSIKQNPATADIPVIFLTGNDSADTVREILSEKPAGYVLKTTPPMIILQKVSSILNPKPKHGPKNKF